MSTPESVVQRQLDAYNAKDIPAWLATYASDAEQFELHGARLAQGHAQMRERIALRFSEPDLHAHLLSRQVMGGIVVDHERITRNFPEGKGTIEMVCVYEVVNGVIVKASFAMDAKQLCADARSAA
jgi:putative hydrolase of HD superfamily